MNREYSITNTSYIKYRDQTNKGEEKSNLDETEFQGEEIFNNNNKDTIIDILREIREITFIKHKQNAFYKRNIQGTNRELWKSKTDSWSEKQCSEDNAKKTFQEKIKKQ